MAHVSPITTDMPSALKQFSFAIRSYFLALSKFSRLIVALVIATATPGVACFCYYTLNGLGEFGNRWSTLVILAYPLALISLMWLVATYFSIRRSNLRLSIAALSFAIPTIFLAIVRF